MSMKMCKRVTEAVVEIAFGIFAIKAISYIFGWNANYKNTDEVLLALENNKFYPIVAEYTPGSFLKNETFAKKAEMMLGEKAYAGFAVLVMTENLGHDLRYLLSQKHNGTEIHDDVIMDLDTGLQELVYNEA